MFNHEFHNKLEYFPYGIYAVPEISLVGATELVYIGQAVITLGGNLEYFVDSAFNYPTLAEAYKGAALNAWNKMTPYKASSNKVVPLIQENNPA